MRTMKFDENVVKFLGKTTLRFSLRVIIVCACFTLFFFMSNCGYHGFNGSYNLGKNIYMMDWDGGGRIIVRGTSFEGNVCYGGERLIPLYENQYDTLGNVVEYVEDAMSDEDWIIARTNNKITLQQKYYILDKRKISDKMTTEEIIKKNIVSFADSIDFVNNCFNKRIKVQWK